MVVTGARGPRLHICARIPPTKEAGLTSRISIRLFARITVCLALVTLACKSEAKKLVEVRACSAITMDAPGAANCLVLQYKWRKREGRVAGRDNGPARSHPPLFWLPREHYPP